MHHFYAGVFFPPSLRYIITQLEHANLDSQQVYHNHLLIIPESINFVQLQQRSSDPNPLIVNNDTTDSDVNADSSSITSQEVATYIMNVTNFHYYMNTKVCVPPSNETGVFKTVSGKVSQHGICDDNTRSMTVIPLLDLLVSIIVAGNNTYNAVKLCFSYIPPTLDIRFHQQSSSK